ncbi:MAG: CdaR family protein [Pseudomonadota bacterium]
MTKPRLLKRLVSNFGYKLTALVLATLVWYIVQGEEVLEVNAKLDVRVDVASGFAVRDAGVMSRDITLRGPRVLVGTLQGKSLQAIIRVPSGKSGNLRYRLDKEFIPGWDNRVRLTIHDPYVNVAVEERLTKKIPVRPVVVGDVPPPLMIDEAKPSPAEIEITGAKSEVSHVTELLTDPIDVNGLKDSKSVTSTLAHTNLPDVELSAREVTVALRVGPKKESKTLSVVPVAIIDTDKVGSVRPAGVTVIVSAPDDVIKHISHKDIHVTVTAKDLAPGRYNLGVLATSPEGVIIQDISPKTVAVEIYNQKKLK